MIRIAYVINYIVKNGPSSVVLNLIDNLDRLEYDIALITLFEGNDSEVASTLQNNGVAVYECKTLSRMKCLLGQGKEFEDYIKKGHFDILHTHGIIPDILSFPSARQQQSELQQSTTICMKTTLIHYGYAKAVSSCAAHGCIKKIGRVRMLFKVCL